MDTFPGKQHNGFSKTWLTTRWIFKERSDRNQESSKPKVNEKASRQEQ
jgi:hypothetical protein